MAFLARRIPMINNRQYFYMACFKIVLRLVNRSILHCIVLFEYWFELLKYVKLIIIFSTIFKGAAHSTYRVVQKRMRIEKHIGIRPNPSSQNCQALGQNLGQTGPISALRFELVKYINTSTGKKNLGIVPEVHKLVKWILFRNQKLALLRWQIIYPKHKVIISFICTTH